MDQMNQHSVDSFDIFFKLKFLHIAPLNVYEYMNLIKMCNNIHKGFFSHLDLVFSLVLITLLGLILLCVGLWCIMLVEAKV